ncbi:MAG: hypothetical protein ACKOBW_01905, partial [Planctomycetota bacterium]
CLCWWSSSVTLAVAQDDDPFGGGTKTKAPAQPVGKAGGRPAAGDKAEVDPVVLTLRETNPQTAEQLARAAKVMLDYGRADEARRYLQGLSALKLDDQAWSTLQTRIGSDVFLRWTNEEKIQPEGAELGRAALAAVKRLSSDEGRLRRLIVGLTSDNPQARREAQLGLYDAGVDAVPQLVAVLADAGRAEEHEAVAQLLVKIGNTVVEPLVGALEAEDAGLKSRLMPVLGTLRARRATPYLLRASLDPSDAALEKAAKVALTMIVGAEASSNQAQLFLAKRVRGHLAGDPAVTLDADDHGQLWHWDAAKKIPVARRYPAYQLAIVEATRLARELYRLAPQSIENRRLYLMTALEEEKSLAGPDQPLPRDGAAAKALVQLGVEALEDGLAFAMKQNRPLAATAITELLGDIGSAALLEAPGGKNRPLSDALGHRDRRLRFAAVEAVMKFNPSKPYAGASFVSDSLGFFASTVGQRRILVAHPRQDDAQTLIGLLRGMGFEADAATTGRGVIVRGIKNPDYEYLLLSDKIDNPPVRELIQALRQDVHTAELPIGLLADLAKFEEADVTGPRSTYRDTTRPVLDPQVRAERLAAGDSRTVAVIRPYDADGLQFVLQRLESTVGRGAVTRDERLRQATKSLEWLGMIAANVELDTIYEVTRQQPRIETALKTPELMGRAALVLGQLGTPTSQLALLDVASEVGRPVEEREAAVAALRAAIKRRGLRLTREEILRQYDRYNKSETLDRDTQRILGDVLDAIEEPTKPATDADQTPGKEPQPDVETKPATAPVSPP